MESSIDICVIEDDGTQRRALVEQLAGAHYRVTQAATAAEGLTIVGDTQPKVVLSELNLPDGDGMEFCRQIKQAESGNEPFFILIASGDDVQQKARALESGADDYLTKPYHPRELIARVAVAMRMWQLRDDLRSAALTDGLTGLWTHQHFTSVLDTEFARVRRYGGHLSLIMCDLDRFKAINDAFGHQCGNAVLKQVADMIRQSVRQLDVPARYGGEEFAVLVPEVETAEAAKLAERLRVRIEREVRIEGHAGFAVTASIGVASVNDHRVVTPEDLVELADRAMYLAKRRERNRVCTAEALSGLDEFPGSERDAEVRQLHQHVAALSLRTREMYVQGVWALVQALEARDPHTANHSRNVTSYAEEIAETLELSDPLRRIVRNAAMLHDIGKIGVPDHVLLKTETLTPEDRKILQRVPMISARIIDHMRILDSEVAVICHQREYYDGSGYPGGLKGNEIPLASRIILVAEAFDSMTTDRCYRPHLSMTEALTRLRAGAGKQFDPRVVEAMERLARMHAEQWQQRIDRAIQLAHEEPALAML